MKTPSTTTRYRWIGWVVLLFPILWAAMLAAQSYITGQGLTKILDRVNACFSTPFHIEWAPQTPRFMFLFLIFYLFGIAIYYSTKKRTRLGEEHGSAIWGDAKAICMKYRDKLFQNNILLTQSFRMGFDSRRHRRNLNVLVVGGSGSGKTRFYALPNIMQCNCSYVITDAKGEILRATGHLLKAQGYDVKVFDLINMNNSFCYNPFVYIRDDKDVLKLVTNLIRNTTPRGANTTDPFWEKSETALLSALMLYLIHEAEPEEQNFSMVMEMLQSAEVREDDPKFKSPLDLLFESLDYTDPDHIAVKQYKVYKHAAGKTAKSILVSLAVRLAGFNLEQIAGITNTDEMDICSLGERKTAIFAVISDNDTSFNYLVGLLYTQIFQSLYYLADHKYGGRLPVHVHFVMDEFANCALPDDYDKILSTMRSREISVSMIVQNMAQLKALFKDNWESLVGNCDSLLYLGGNEASTHEYISRLLGKATIDTNTYGRSKGRNGSYTTNDQHSGRELLTPDEVRLLDNKFALLFLRGERAIMDAKIDILKHPNVKCTVDGGQDAYHHGEIPFAVSDLHCDVDTKDMNLLDSIELLDDDGIENLIEEIDELKNKKEEEYPHD